MRTEAGSGTRLRLDIRQLFFQLVIQRDNPMVPLGLESFYQKVLESVIWLHRRLWISAEDKTRLNYSRTAC
jgi:lipoate-protein ligase A